MSFSTGRIGGALAVCLLAAGLAKPALAGAPDVVVYCDPTLVPAMRSVGALFTAGTQVQVNVFSAPPTLMLAQLAREVQNDALVTQASWMDRVEAAGLIKPGTRVGGWRNHLVIARATAAAPPDGVFARPDPTPAATIDGPAVLAALGLQPPRVIGAANSAEVAFLLETGAAQRGLLHVTDVRADADLVIAEPVADAAYPPIVYAAALTKVTQSVNAPAFLDFLRSAGAAERLRATGLEVVP